MAEKLTKKALSDILGERVDPKDRTPHGWLDAARILLSDIRTRVLYCGALSKRSLRELLIALAAHCLAWVVYMDLNDADAREAAGG